MRGAERMQEFYRAIGLIGSAVDQADAKAEFMAKYGLSEDAFNALPDVALQKSWQKPKSQAA